MKSWLLFCCCCCCLFVCFFLITVAYLISSICYVVFSSFVRVLSICWYLSSTWMIQIFKCSRFASNAFFLVSAVDNINFLPFVAAFQFTFFSPKHLQRARSNSQGKTVLCFLFSWMSWTRYHSLWITISKCFLNSLNPFNRI